MLKIMSFSRRYSFELKRKYMLCRKKLRLLRLSKKLSILIKKSISKNVSYHLKSMPPKFVLTTLKVLGLLSFLVYMGLKLFDCFFSSL